MDFSEENEKLEEQLLKTYVEENYDNLEKRNFSWCALLLGPAYFAHRKLYVTAMLIMASCYTILVAIMEYEKISIITRIQIQFLAFIIYRIIQGIVFKKLYLKKTLKKIDKIKEKNSDKETSELMEIVKQKGGTNPIIATIVALFSIYVIWPLFYEILLMIKIFIF